MENPFSQALENTIPTSKNHIPFPEACAYYGALRCGVPQAAIASIAGVAPVTVAYLNRAGEFRSGQKRYPKIAAEYDQLGHDAFIHTYLTPAIRASLLHAIELLNKGLLPERKSNFARQRANGLVGFHVLKPRNQWQVESARIQIETIPQGYRWVLHALGSFEYAYEHAPKSEPFATSREAFNAAKTRFTPTESEMELNSKKAIYGSDAP